MRAQNIGTRHSISLTLEPILKRCHKGTIAFLNNKSENVRNVPLDANDFLKNHVGSYEY